MPEDVKQHDCEQELEKSYPSHTQAEDGQVWQCSCGRVWVHICDEAEGCCWVPSEDHTEETS